MSSETTSSEKIGQDEKSTGSAKLESMTKEELIRLVKNQIVLRKKQDAKINELTDINTSLSQTVQQLHNQIGDEQSKFSNLLTEFDAHKRHQSKLEEDLRAACESQADFQSHNELLKASCHTLKEELSNLQNELSVVRGSLSNGSDQSSLLPQFISTTNDIFQLPISMPEIVDETFLNMYRSELEQKQEHFKQTCEQLEQEKAHLQQRIEDMEFFTEEMKLEVDDLRCKSSKHQQDKQALEREIGNYRRQVEDFEEQFLEVQRECGSHPVTLDKSQSITSSLLTLSRSDENIDQISFQCIDAVLNQIDDSTQHISKASSTSSLLLSSDIPTLLHSIGIANCTDEDFSVPLNFESVLRLCTLLIERCRVLQYILLKNNDISIHLPSANDYENPSTSTVQRNGYEQCRISVHREEHAFIDTIFERLHAWMNEPIGSSEWQMVITKPIEQHLSPYIRLEFDHMKFVSAQVEDDLLRTRCQLDEASQENEEQRQEISLLEKQLHSNNAYELLKQQQTYLEQQLVKQCEKTLHLENVLKQENLDRARLDQFRQIELSYHELQEKYRIAQQLEEQLEQLKEKLILQDRQLKNKQDIIPDYERALGELLERNERIRVLELQVEQQEHEKLASSNATSNRDDRYSSLLEQQQELNRRLETQIGENKDLAEKNAQLIIEKTRQIDDLHEQWRAETMERDAAEVHANALQEKRSVLQKELDLAVSKIAGLEEQNFDLMETIGELRQKSFESAQTNPNVDEALTQSDKTGEPSEHGSNEDDAQRRIDQLQSESVTSREESENLHRTIRELNERLENSAGDSKENVRELKEKYQKMKVLLTRLKKELQDRAYQPKQSLIDLELADYEKTINHLKDDLTSKEKDIQDLRDELSATTERYTRLKREVDNIEQQKLQADERANKFKALLDSAKKELRVANDLEQERHHGNDDARVSVDKLRVDLDAKNVLVSELRNDKQQLTEKLDHLMEINQKTTLLLEQNLRITKHELDIAKQDYSTLQDDFNSYKIRAQSVLKQHQSNQRERTPSVPDRQHELEETIETLKATLREANTKIHLVISENEILQKEQDRLVEAQAKLIHQSRKREQDLVKQHQMDLERLESTYSQRINDSFDTIKEAALQNETLSMAFKEQLTTLDADHERSIAALHSQLHVTRQEMDELRVRLDEFRQASSDPPRGTSSMDRTPIGINSDSKGDEILAWSAPEHQHEEVSELTHADHRANDSSTNTLVNLLPVTDTPPRRLLDDTELERQRLDELNAIKMRLLDANELLNESELNNVRLTEQIALLKDEIRRIERNVDRAESLSNLEYLKNIILKFFVLKSTPERLQLIPVLVTMLKLSPDEQAQLVRVANLTAPVEDNPTSPDSSPADPTMNAANVSAPSWGTYLNIW